MYERTAGCGTADAPYAGRKIGRVISRVCCFVLQGVDAVRCEIEADLVRTETPRTAIEGLPNAAVKESIDRVRTAILIERVSVSAAAVLLAGGAIVESTGSEGIAVESFLLAGELALDGPVRPIMAHLARELGMRGVIVASASAIEAALVKGIEVRGAATPADVVGMLNGVSAIKPHPAVDIESLIAEMKMQVDFADVRGHEAAKGALTIAAAGSHNVLMIGPAGTGQTVSVVEAGHESHAPLVATGSQFAGTTSVPGKVIESRQIAFGLPRGVVEAKPECAGAGMSSKSRRGALPARKPGSPPGPMGPPPRVILPNHPSWPSGAVLLWHGLSVI